MAWKISRYAWKVRTGSGTLTVFATTKRTDSVRGSYFIKRPRRLRVDISSMRTRTRIILLILVAHQLFLASSFAADQITDWTIEVGEEGRLGLWEMRSPYSTYTYVCLGSFEFSVDLPLYAVIAIAFLMLALIIGGVASLFRRRQPRNVD